MEGGSCQSLELTRAYAGRRDVGASVYPCAGSLCQGFGRYILPRRRMRHYVAVLIC